MEKALKNSKTNIKSVSTISEAWVDIEKNEFDLIICDVVLPDGDGLELVKKVKLKKNSQPFLGCHWLFFTSTGAGGPCWRKSRRSTSPRGSSGSDIARKNHR